MSRLIGVIDLGPLPGSANFGGDLPSVLRLAAADARVLAGAGFDALIVENFGDAPFFADSEPVLIGSGATEGNVAGLVEVATGIIVGTALKVDGVTTNPVDPARATSFVKAAG